MQERFIFILKYALAYVEERTSDSISKLQKNIMRYQQIFATFNIRAKLDAGTKRGVICHTQGSGKTTIAFHNVKILNDYYGRKNITTQFYFIVDRLELLQQAANEFRKRGLDVNEISSKKKFVEVLQSVGNSGKLSISVIDIQKFSADSISKESDFNVNVQRIYLIHYENHIDRNQ